MAKSFDRDTELAGVVTPDDDGLGVTKQWFEDYLDEKRTENDRAVRDREYIDGLQWTDEEQENLRQAGRPMITINRIQPKLNSILGQEVRTRVDPHAEPVTPAHQDSAPVVTDALQYVDRNVGFDRIRSLITEDILGMGAGGCVVGFNDQDEVTTKRFAWREFYYDPKSLEADFSDAKYLGISKWWDLEDALADPDYGKHPEILEESVANRGGAGTEVEDWSKADNPQTVWADSHRQRLRICEVYWRQMDPESGRMVWMTAHHTAAGWLIEPSQTYLLDDRGQSQCPLIATSCYVIQEGESAGERYGIVRNMISAQDEINHRRSRALGLMNEAGAYYEDGAVHDPNQAKQQMSEAGGMVRLERDALRDGRFQPRSQGDLAQGQVALYQDAKQEVDATGPSLPVTAGDQRVMSGRAILARQNIGVMELERVFDNIRDLQMRVFKSWWWTIRLVWTAERFFRVRDSAQREGFRFVGVNRSMARTERLDELLEEQVPFDSAINQLGLQKPVLTQVVGEANQLAQQQVQQQMSGMVQQVAATGQQLPPELMQQMQQQAAALVPQLTEQLIRQHPVMLEPFMVNELAQLGMDIIIDTAPDATLAAQEEFSEILDLLGKGVQNLPRPLFEALIESSNLRDKRRIIEAMAPEQDQAAMQAQQAQMQMQMEMMQAQLANLQANAQLTAAKVQTEQATAAKTAEEAQAVPFEAQKDQAQAAKFAAEAGSNLAPLPEGGGPTPTQGGLQ